MGKHRPNYTPHVDSGDYVVVINADKLVATGSKFETKKYYRHSGHPGSMKIRNLENLVAKDSREAIELAIYGMLPKNKLRSGRMQRLKVFKLADHTHDPQKPVEYKEK